MLHHWGIRRKGMVRRKSESDVTGMFGMRLRNGPVTSGTTSCACESPAGIGKKGILVQHEGKSRVEGMGKRMGKF